MVRPAATGRDLSSVCGPERLLIVRGPCRVLWWAGWAMGDEIRFGLSVAQLPKENLEPLEVIHEKGVDVIDGEIKEQRMHPLVGFTDCHFRKSYVGKSA